MREPRWLGKAVVIAIHERLLAEHGGLAGTFDGGRLESALASPLNHFRHGERDPFRLATAYACALTRDHPFHDGNKRVALTACGVFLELNGYRLEAAEPEAAAAVLALSARGLDESGFAGWLKAVCRRIEGPKSGRTAARTRTGRKPGRRLRRQGR